MKHLTICDYGVFLGAGQSPPVGQAGGVYLSSDLIEVFSCRDITVFLDFSRHCTLSTILGTAWRGRRAHGSRCMPYPVRVFESVI